MAYMHIENLYRDQEILRQGRCYALEKIHGTSAHVGVNEEGTLHFYSGGVERDPFVALFDEKTRASIAELMALARRAGGSGAVTIYGEACGGKCMKMSHAYGKDLRFVAFDVRYGDAWLTVPEAARVVAATGLDFVAWEEGPCTVAWLDSQRDLPSSLAERLGLGPQIREGIVVRPLVEQLNRHGKRLIVKHKRAEFSETKTPREVDPARHAMLVESEKIAQEWVTEMRLTHVLDKLGNPTEPSAIPKIIEAMIEDVEREAAGEIVPSKAARKAIGARAAVMFKQRLRDSLKDAS